MSSIRRRSKPRPANYLKSQSPAPKSKPTDPITASELVAASQSRTVKRSRRWYHHLGWGILVYGTAAYGFYFYFSFINPKEKRDDEKPGQQRQDVDLASVWNATASTFDSDVSFEEKFAGLWYLRRKLIKQASGHVLEVSAGTGMNFKHYDLHKCKSITFLDQSGPMLDLAKQKWRHMYPKTEFVDKSPEGTAIAFRKESAMDMANKPQDGYDTIVQTMGVCSTPEPAKVLSHLGALVNQKTGRLLLIEHGRGYYNWINYILDRDARRHAEKYGCYHNRDIGQIIADSGLVVESMRRPLWWNLGTVWVIEARPKGWTGKGS